MSDRMRDVLRNVADGMSPIEAFLADPDSSIAKARQNRAAMPEMLREVMERCCEDCWTDPAEVARRVTMDLDVWPRNLGDPVLRGPAPGGGSPAEQRTYADGYRDAQHDRDDLEKEQRRLRLRGKILADPDVDIDAGILHPEAGVARPGEDAPEDQSWLSGMFNALEKVRSSLSPAEWTQLSEAVNTYGQALFAKGLRGTPPSSPSEDAKLLDWLDTLPCGISILGDRDHPESMCMTPKQPGFSHTRDLIRQAMKSRGGPTPSREQPPK